MPSPDEYDIFENPFFPNGDSKERLKKFIETLPVLSSFAEVDKAAMLDGKLTKTFPKRHVSLACRVYTFPEAETVEATIRIMLPDCTIEKSVDWTNRNFYIEAVSYS